MKKSYSNIERKGLPGGPNEEINYSNLSYSTEGYKRFSPDVNNPFNIINSGNNFYIKIPSRGNLFYENDTLKHENEIHSHHYRDRRPCAGLH